MKRAVPCRRGWGAALWPWLLLLLLTLLAFWPMFQNGFVWDDPAFVVGNKAIRELWPPSRFFQSQGSPAEGTIYPLTGQRPVMAFSLALDYAFWKLRPLGYHLTNFLLHLLCVFGVAWLTRRWSGSRVAGFLAGCLFALHPGHAEAVIAFLGRSDLLATLFVLLGFGGYLESLEAEGWRKKALYGVSLGSYLLACFAKETGLVLAGLLVVYEAFVAGGFQPQVRNLKSKIIRLLPFLLVAAFYWWYRSRVLGGQWAGSKWWGGRPYMNALMAFEVYAGYLRLLVFPLSLSPLHTVPVPAGLGDSGVLWGALLLLLSLAGIVWALRKRPRLGLWASGVILGLVPVANLIPIPGAQIMAERWLYLPSVGACVLGGWGAWVLYGRAQKWTKGVWVALVAGILILLGVHTFLWTPTWRTEESVARAMVAASPQSALGYNNLGFALGQQGKYEEAIAACRKAIELKPDFALAYYNLGNALDDQGKTGKAIASYRMAIELKPDFALAYYNLGNALRQQGKYEEAIAAYRKAIELKSDFAGALENLANLLDSQGRRKEARGYWERAEKLEMRPEWVVRINKRLAEPD